MPGWRGAACCRAREEMRGERWSAASAAARPSGGGERGAVGTLAASQAATPEPCDAAEAAGGAGAAGRAERAVSSAKGRGAGVRLLLSPQTQEVRERAMMSQDTERAERAVSVGLTLPPPLRARRPPTVTPRPRTLAMHSALLYSLTTSTALIPASPRSQARTRKKKRHPAPRGHR